MGMLIKSMSTQIVALWCVITASVALFRYAQVTLCINHSELSGYCACCRHYINFLLQMLTYWSDLENSVQFVLLACRNWWMLILHLGNAWMKLFVCTTQLRCWICWKFCTELASSMGTSSLIISSYVVTGVFRSALCFDNRHYTDGTHFHFLFFMILISYEYFLRDWCPFWNVLWSLFSLSEVHILQWQLGRVATWSAWALETSGLIFYEWHMQAVDRH